jgi:hypothetical protein
MIIYIDMNIETAEYEVIETKSPFLVSAPHVHTHKRPSLTGVYRQGEVFTDVICRDICTKTGASGILLTKNIEYDPNFFKIENNLYKREVEEMCKKDKKKLFLDIHGLSESHDYDIAIYYLSHFGKSKRIARGLRDVINADKLKGVSINIFRFPDNDQETLSGFVASKLKIPALQIEIAGYIREDDELRDTLVKNISSFLNSY